MRRFGIVLLGSLLGLCAATTWAATDTLTVAYAGSMGVVMDRSLGPTYAKRHDVSYRGIGRGSWGLARLLASKQIRSDVFVSITPGPMRLLIDKGLIKYAVPIASTQMVIAYSPQSRFASQFKAAAAGKKPWYKVLEQPGIRFGRTDPKVDPQGRNIIFTMLLAERYYRQPELADKILGRYQNPRQIFSETSLLTRLESGQIDATSGYLSAVISHHLPYITLPDAINLSNPKDVQNWYSKVRFKITLPTGMTKTLHTQPLVFYAGVLDNARNPGQARKFIAFLQGPRARKLLRKQGYSRPKGGPLK